MTEYKSEFELLFIADTYIRTIIDRVWSYKCIRSRGITFIENTGLGDKNKLEQTGPGTENE